jgi:hypothetical protein
MPLAIGVPFSQLFVFVRTFVLVSFGVWAFLQERRGLDETYQVLSAVLTHKKGIKWVSTFTIAEYHLLVSRQFFGFDYLRQCRH